MHKVSIVVYRLFYLSNPTPSKLLTDYYGQGVVRVFHLHVLSCPKNSTKVILGLPPFHATEFYAKPSDSGLLELPC